MVREGIRFNGRVSDEVADGSAEKKFVYSCTDDGVIGGVFACPWITELVVMMWTPDVNEMKLSADSLQNSICWLSCVGISAAFIALWVRDGVEIACNYIIVVVSKVVAEAAIEWLPFLIGSRDVNID